MDNKKSKDVTRAGARARFKIARAPRFQIQKRAGNFGRARSALERAQQMNDQKNYKNYIKN